MARKRTKHEAAEIRSYVAFLVVLSASQLRSLHLGIGSNRVKPRILLNVLLAGGSVPHS